MKTLSLPSIAVVLTLIANGCSRQVESSTITVEKPYPMLRIESFALSDSDARFAYHVDNSFDHDIWVCEDMDGRGGNDVMQNAETAVEGKTLWIRLRFNLQSSLLTYFPIYARYRRLGPGESCSGTIALSLPVESTSPIRKFYGRRVALSADRVILEVGYLTGDLPTMLLETRAKTSRRPTDDPNLAFVPFGWGGLGAEKVAEATLSDVAIPCVARIETKVGEN